MTTHENLLSLSTATLDDDRPRRYVSAEHALGCYFRAVSKIVGAPGLDPESLGAQVQTQPSSENPHIERIDDVRKLATCFEYAKRRAGPKVWGAWRAHRVDRVSLAKIRGTSKSSAHRHVHAVDSFIESWLSERGLLINNKVKEVEE